MHRGEEDWRRALGGISEIFFKKGIIGSRLNKVVNEREKKEKTM